jgi:hypothetical protein
MSRALLTLAQAKRHLQIDVYEPESEPDPEAGVHDKEIMEKVEEASEAVLAHLKDPDFLDSDGCVVVYDVPPLVRAAAKLMLGYLWEHRDEDAEGAYAGGKLPAGVRALLASMRTPTLA